MKTKITWKLFTSDYDIKTYQVFHENTLIGYVDVEYYEGRIDQYRAVPSLDGCEIKVCYSRKESNAHLFQHKGN